MFVHFLVCNECTQSTHYAYSRENLNIYIAMFVHFLQLVNKTDIEDERKNNIFKDEKM